MSHGWQFGDDTAQNELVEPGMKFLSYSIMEPVYLVGKPIIGMAIFGWRFLGRAPRASHRPASLGGQSSGSRDHRDSPSPAGAPTA